MPATEKGTRHWRARIRQWQMERWQRAAGRAFRRASGATQERDAPGDPAAAPDGGSRKSGPGN